MKRYALGLDFGTLSGRALLAEVPSGREVCSAVCDYPHGVLDVSLPTGEALSADWALQNPADWLEVLRRAVPEVLAKSGVSPEEIVGIGSDFTACTLLPVRADGTPLCFLPEFAHKPHAWPKLWKHHAAQPQATRLTVLATQRREAWLANYGGKISSEWALPKIWQVLEEAPEIYEAADLFVEASDWLTWQLCGELSRNSCAAGYKGLWNRETGYPSDDYLCAADPRLSGLAPRKLSGPVVPLGGRAGVLTPQAAGLTGLCAGTPVAVGLIDAHAGVPAAGVDGPGKLLAIMGTSTCHIVLSESGQPVPGVCGVVADGVLPGYYAYEAGQACVGDHFAWFIENCLPAALRDRAQAENKSVYTLLHELAERQRPGESGLLALDWWNGNRSVLADADLSGLLLGMTLRTRPEEIYRALIEATAYGTRMIVENYRAGGVPVRQFIASGGISRKDPMTMQIYADVLNMPVYIAASTQSGALGSAIFGAVAAGEAGGGFASAAEAARSMGSLAETVYRPKPQNAAVYNELYEEYCRLHDYFGRGENDVMKRLKSLRQRQSGQ